MHHYTGHETVRILYDQDSGLVYLRATYNATWPSNSSEFCSLLSSPLGLDPPTWLENRTHGILRQESRLRRAAEDLEIYVPVV